MNPLKDPVVETCLENVRLNAESKGSDPTSTLKGYRASIKQFTTFVNSEKGLQGELTPTDMVEEARQDIRKAKIRIQEFFVWLQGSDADERERAPIDRKYNPWTVKGKPKSVKRTSAGIKSFGVIRGFYTNNGLDFGKWSTPNIRDMIKTTIENDRQHPIFVYDETKGEYHVDYSRLRFFVDMLSLRDQSILLALLSTGQDIGEILALKLSWFRQQADRRRLSFRGFRSKTGVPFWTFFSREATDMVRKYVQINRADARDEEAIYVTRRFYNGGEGEGEQRPLSSEYYASILARISEQMGILPEGTTQNPFRPKRMRHIFQTACENAGVSDKRSKAFLGHAGGIEMVYIERHLAEHESQYAIVEPYLTVYNPNPAEDLSELRAQLGEVEALKTLTVQQATRIEELQKTVTNQGNEIKDLRQLFESRVARLEKFRERAQGP